MYLDPTFAAAEAHRAQLLAEARQQRLVALATCCRPSTLARYARALLTWARPQRVTAAARPCCV